MKYIREEVWVGLVACALVIFGGISALRSSMPSAEQYAASSTVYVDIDGEGSHGSGVVIGNGLIITNHHVVDKLTDKSVVIFPDGSKVPFKVIWKGAAPYDLALLQADTGSVKPAAINCAQAPMGTEIFVHGHPLSLRSITTWGRVASAAMPSLAEKADIADFTVIDVAITGGNSGGGVWSGRYLVGIATAVPLRTSGMCASQTGHGIMIASPAVCRALGRA
jgi:S1-C subfamily serine protease